MFGLSAGDIVSQHKLDNSQFLKKLKESALAGDRFADKAERQSRKIEKSWWSRFGQVAVGFTIAYRAMNAFEAGLSKLTQTTIEATKESGELASIQAKLAFWFKMHSETAISYADAFDRAAKNTQALAKASLTSISSLEELATGLDEVAQSVGSVPERLIPALADVVDFTVMVAQTTGSTTRQVRQELQALMQGQMRTTNILIRAMKNLGVITEEDIANLKSMTNRAEIMEKILLAISKHWSEVRERLISTDVNIDIKFWEKSMRRILVNSIQLASQLEHTGNIFAEEFAKRGRKAVQALGEELPSIEMERFIVLMQSLRDVLAFGLDVYEKMIGASASLAVAVRNLSDPLKVLAKVLGGYLAFSAVSKIFEQMGKIILWLAKGPVMLLLKVMNLVYIRFLAIPAAITASAIAVEVLLDMLKERMPDVGKKTKSMLSDMADKTKEATKGWIDLKGTVKLFTDAYGYWKRFFAGAKVPEAVKKEAEAAGKIYKEVAKGIAGFADEFYSRYKEKSKAHLGVLMDILGPEIEKLEKKLEDLFRPEPMPFDWEQYLPDAKEAGEGLGWAFKSGWDEITRDILKEGMDNWYKAVEKMQKEIDKAIQKTEKFLDKLEEKWAGFMHPFKEYIESLEEIDTLMKAGRLTQSEGFTAATLLLADTIGKAIGIAQQIVDFLPNLFDSITNLVWSIRNWPKTAIESFKGLAASLGFGGAEVDRAGLSIERIEKLNETIEDLTRQLEKLGDSLVSGFVGAMETLYDQIEAELPTVFAQLGPELIPQYEFGYGVPVYSTGGIPSPVPSQEGVIAGINAAAAAALQDFFNTYIVGNEQFIALSEETQGVIANLVATADGIEDFQMLVDYWTELTSLWEDMSYSIADMLGNLTPLEKELISINSQFDDWIAQLAQLGASEEALIQVEELRQDAIQNLISTQQQELVASLTEMGLGGDELTLYRIIQDFQTVMQQIAEWSAVTGESYEGLVAQAIDVYSLEMEAAMEQSEAAQAIQDSIDQWQRVIESLDDTIFDMQATLTSPQDVFERMAYVMEQILGYYPSGLAGPTDVLTPEDMDALQNLWETYLELAQDAYQRPSQEYQDVYDMVLGELEDLRGEAENLQTAYEVELQELDALNTISDLLGNVYSGAEGSIQDLLSNIASSITSQDLSVDVDMGDISIDLNVTVEVPEPSETVEPVTAEDYIVIDPIQWGFGAPPVIRDSESKPHSEFSLVVNVSESKNPQSTADAIVDKLENWVRSSRGRAIIQGTAAGR